MFASDDDMVECPYNKAHLMLRKRLQSHLLKCRRQYPDVELQKCPFNATHLVPEPEFTHHVTNCPDRKLITQYKYDAPEQKEEEIPSHAPIECEENWDDTDEPDYDPTKYAETATIIRIPDGPTPSERKQFIKKERIRLGDDSSEDSDGDDVLVIPVTNSPDVEYQGNGRSERLRSRSIEPSPPRSRSPMPFYNRPSTSSHYQRNRSPPSKRSCLENERRRSRSPRSKSPQKHSDHSTKDQSHWTKRSSHSRSPKPYYNRPSTSTHYNRDRSPPSKRSYHENIRRRSKSPKNHSNCPTKDQPHSQSSSRSISPMPYYNRPSTSTHYNKERSPPSKRSYRENSYNVDDDPYYNQSNSRVSTGGSRRSSHNSCDSDSYNRGSRRSRDGYDSPGPRNYYTSNYKK